MGGKCGMCRSALTWRSCTAMYLMDLLCMESAQALVNANRVDLRTQSLAVRRVASTCHAVRSRILTNASLVDLFSHIAICLSKVTGLENVATDDSYAKMLQDALQICLDHQTSTIEDGPNGAVESNDEDAVTSESSQTDAG